MTFEQPTATVSEGEDRALHSEQNSELEQLRAQVKSLGLSLARRKRDSLGLGVLLLAFSPYALYVPGIVLQSSPNAYGFLYFVVHGSLAGCLLAQWSLIAVFCVLNWRPAWQRCVLFLVLATLMATIGLAPVVPIQLLSHSASDKLELLVDVSYEFVEVITWLPGMIAMAMLPCFAVKVTRRWTTGPITRNIEPRSTTLLTYFTTTAVCGLGVILAKRLLTLLAVFGDPDQMSIRVLYFVLYAGVASLAAGLVQVWVLADVLERQHHAWRQWIWRIPLILLVGGGVLTIVYLIGKQTVPERFPLTDASGVAAVAGYSVSIVLTAAFVFWSGCRWMRMLGHGLYRTREKV